MFSLTKRYGINNNNKIINNAIHLYILVGVKLVVPLLILPYLARILSTRQYAVYLYVRAIATFVNLFIDFGFIYSGTQRISQFKDDKEKIGKVISDITGAKLILLAILCLFGSVYLLKNETTRDYFSFSFTTLLATALINILPDFLFRGIERMEILSRRMVVSRAITTALLFVFVRDEEDFIYVAILELINALLAFGFTVVWLLKNDYRFEYKAKIKDCLKEIKEGSNYFIFTAAPFLYGAVNTIVIGNTLSELEVVFWGTAWNVVSSIMNFYGPLSNAIFPNMTKQRNPRVVKKMLFIFIPVVIVGCIVMMLCSKWVFFILAGTKYYMGHWTLKLLIPTLFLSFLSIMYGAPVLGALGREKELRNSSIWTAIFHIFSLFVMKKFGVLSLANVCILRNISELICFVIRYIFVKKYRLLEVRKENNIQ